MTMTNAELRMQNAEWLIPSDLPSEAELLNLAVEYENDFFKVSDSNKFNPVVEPTNLALPINNLSTISNPIIGNKSLQHSLHISLNMVVIISSNYAPSSLTASPSALHASLSLNQSINQSITH